MLPAQYRLIRRSEISETIRRGMRARRGAVVVHLLVEPSSPVGAAPPTRRAPSGSARAAFAVSKSVGNSVTRHRVVRRLRALLPPLLEELPAGSRVVVRAMPEAADASSAQMRGDLEAAFARLQRDVPASSGGSTTAVVGASGDAEAREMPAVRDGREREAGEESAGADEPMARGPFARIGWIIGTPFRWLLLGLVWAYRHTISPILPPTCRYHPSCSAYAFEALQVHGAAKGFVLATWRVLRCNPFTPGGLDPVPSRGAWKPDILPDGRPRTPAPGAAASS